MWSVGNAPRLCSCRMQLAQDQSCIELGLKRSQRRRLPAIDLIGLLSHLHLVTGFVGWETESTDRCHGARGHGSLVRHSKDEGSPSGT
jgi:hypothetical protein